MSNWRQIRGYTDKAVKRIGRAEYERQRQWEEGLDTLGEGISLWQKHQEGKATQTALEEFGTSEGLTYDEDTKSFYGRQEDGQRYKISPAELTNMQNFGKYTDKGISDFVSTKDGNIKTGYKYDLPDTPVAPNVSVVEGESYFSDEDPELPKDNKRIQTVKGDPRASMKVDGEWIGSAKYQESSLEVKPNEIDYLGNKLEGWKTAANRPVIGSFAEGELYDWEGEIQEAHELQETNILSNKAKEDEMKNLLDIQRKKQQEFDAKVEADKKAQEEERIRLENIKNTEALNKLEEVSSKELQTMRSSNTWWNKGDEDAGGRSKWTDFLFNNEDEGYDAR